MSSYITLATAALQGGGYAVNCKLGIAISANQNGRGLLRWLRELKWMFLRGSSCADLDYENAV
jgi:hypothetical protein